MAHWNMLAGWAGMFCGLVSGAAIGLFFHKDGFAGGYGAFQRRMLRLGHIAFFGLGIINVVFSLTLGTLEDTISYPVLASASLIAGAVLMPLVCFLAAWIPSFRHLFALPVTCVAITLILLLHGMVSP